MFKRKNILPAVICWIVGIALSLCVAACVNAQTQQLLIFPPRENVVTDSVVWKIVEVDSVHQGDINCNHIWVYSQEWRAGGSAGCCVIHHGEHCSWDDSMRNRICSKCKRKETQREVWYEHRLEHIKSEYEKLEENLLNKEK